MIPEDIEVTAQAAVEAMPDRPPFKSDVAQAIARAILAERKRCAEIAGKGIIHGHFYATGITKKTYEAISAGERSA